MATEKEIAAILGILGSVYPRYTLTQQTISAYCLLLRDIPGDELKTAALNCASTGDFFPSVHELREAVAGMRRKSLKLPTAAEAWRNLLDARGSTEYRVLVQENGNNVIEIHPYKFLAGVREVAESLGWPRQYLVNPDDQMADRAHFLKAYDAWINGQLENEMMLPEVKAHIERKQKLLEAQNG